MQAVRSYVGGAIGARFIFLWGIADSHACIWIAARTTAARIPRRPHSLVPGPGLEPG